MVAARWGPLHRADPVSGAPMLEGQAVVAALRQCGITHVIWIPDTELGSWEPALRAEPSIALLRVCREGEALAIAAGLILGGRKPVVMIQCTGLFEAGDALRNIVHDLKLPVFLIVGLRSYYAHQRGESRDTCPIFTEPILRAWQIPYVLVTREHSASDLVHAYQQAQSEGRAAVALIGE